MGPSCIQLHAFPKPDPCSPVLSLDCLRQFPGDYFPATVEADHGGTGPLEIDHGGTGPLEIDHGGTGPLEIDHGGTGPLEIDHGGTGPLLIPSVT